MNVKLYVINGSHPCATVERALQLKGIPYSLVEFPPPMHMAAMKLRFGSRTVPGITIDGEKLSGSRAILRRLDQLKPEPALLPSNPAERAGVEEAEAWGDDVLQVLTRRVLWPTFAAHPEAMATYSRGLEAAAGAAAGAEGARAVVTRIEMKANGADPATYAQALRDLPAALDRVDAWIADGTLGGEQPNAADLQIAVQPAAPDDGRGPAAADRVAPGGGACAGTFPDFPGDAAAGIIPADLLPASVAA